MENAPRGKDLEVGMLLHVDYARSQNYVSKFAKDSDNPIWKTDPHPLHPGSYFAAALLIVA